MTIYDKFAAALTAGAYTAATRPAVNHGLDERPWRDAVDLGRRQLITAAGLFAAHAIRLHVAEEHADDQSAWVPEVADAADAIAAEPDSDRRALAAMAIRRAITRGPVGDPDTEPARLLAAWLYPAAADAAAGQLARYVVQNADRYEDLYGPAWYAVHGPDLLRVLVARQPAAAAAGGRPRLEAADVRAALRIAVRGVAAARIMPKTRLAEMAGASRPTVDNWLR